MKANMLTNVLTTPAGQTKITIKFRTKDFVPAIRSIKLRIGLKKLTIERVVRDLIAN